MSKGLKSRLRSDMFIPINAKNFFKWRKYATAYANMHPFALNPVSVNLFLLVNVELNIKQNVIRLLEDLRLC